MLPHSTSTPKPTHTKNATRAESLLNCLLCLRFNTLRLAEPKFNPTYICKQNQKLKNRIKS
ncbi:hypothetical protein A79_0915 [Vibrio parahaemolyticus AQ3810]|nr:hypothetical protein A79_0915 [Vibrio parahaemolyticus AQ3810]EXF66593.1 hypothetical protein D030_5484 [Vibrio parahaemolyticus AQ3810]